MGEWDGKGAKSSEENKIYLESRTPYSNTLHLGGVPNREFNPCYTE